MRVIEARNVNDALAQGLALLEQHGERRDSRAGPVICCPEPVTTVYQRPLERVLMHPGRDANPFFHLFESVWMLAGRDDVASVARYASNMRNYSDDGATLHGAYGRRWRRWFSTMYIGAQFDQLRWAVRRLKVDPNDRRVVIGMWDPAVDPFIADKDGKDVPCNTQLYLWVSSDGRTNLTVSCRSNDIIWGAYGANAVHFSYLLEYVSACLGREVGQMWQVSNNYHAYERVLEKTEVPLDYQPYAGAEYSAIPIILNGCTEDCFDEDLAMFLDEGVTFGLRSQWLRRVVHPMMMAHRAYKKKMALEDVLVIIGNVRDAAWERAGREWLQRRFAERERAKDDGVRHDDN